MPALPHAVNGDDLIELVAEPVPGHLRGGYAQVSIPEHLGHLFRIDRAETGNLDRGVADACDLFQGPGDVADRLGVFAARKKLRPQGAFHHIILLWILLQSVANIGPPWPAS